MKNFTLRNDRISQKTKAETSFIVWDPALEEMIKSPINKNLQQKKIKWRPKSAVVPHPNEPERSRIERTITREASFANLTMNEITEVRTREVMIHNMINSPLSPRKKTRVPFQKRIVKFHDQHTLERVYHERVQKFPLETTGQRKTETKALVRSFSIPITHGVVKQSPYKWN